MPDELSKVGVTNAQVEALEGARLLSKSTQVPIRIEHTFAPGIVVRTMFVPANTEVIGHEHKTDHVNMLLQGACEIVAGHETIKLRAPLIFTAKAGVRKVARFSENSVWANVLPNPTNETNLDKIEEMFVAKSPVFLAFESQLKEPRSVSALSA